MNGEFDRLADIQLLWIARGEFQHHPGANVNYRTDTLAYAIACHATDVEVHIDTREIRILSYIALQDSGVSFNPMMVDDQVHGGVAHGIGNALFEWMGYDAGANHDKLRRLPSAGVGRSAYDDDAVQ